MKTPTSQKQPDILEVIADLSNDEVFTPPKLANSVLDKLPEAVWKNPNLRFLDLGSKTGVFLREIAKRLMIGLESTFPNEQSRLDHILKNQLWGLPTSELTALMTRRTVYGSKTANGAHSLTGAFGDEDGNIWFGRVEHTFKSGRCQECGGSSSIEREGRENYAYTFIHNDGRNKFEEKHQLQFDVIVGNPPYQLDDDSDSPSASPIYNLFIDQARALKPKYLAMIVPSRWMLGGKGLDKFRDSMLSDNRIRKLVDYQNAADIFSDVGINGGVCYFLWDRDNPGPCDTSTEFLGLRVESPERNLGEFDVLLRDGRASSIVRKVARYPSFSLRVSSRKPFGLPTTFRGSYIAEPGQIEVFQRGGKAWMNPDEIKAGVELLKYWKVLIRRTGSGREREKNQLDVVIFSPDVVGPDVACTETYLVVGPFLTEIEAKNAAAYVRTKFFRFLVQLRKASQDVPRNTYFWVPEVDLSKTWTDTALYKHFQLTETEIELIELRVKELVE